MKKIVFFLALVLSASIAGAQSVTNLTVDKSASSIKWDAQKVVGGHHGTIGIKEGTVQVTENRLTGGRFVIDMPSLVCIDAPRVTDHLKNEDFFDVEKNPTATFVISKVDQTTSGVNITGKLTIKGITKDITFPATVSLANNRLSAKATVKVNRLDYDIKFRSASFFSGLGDRAIEDHFTLEINLVAAAN